MSLQVRDREKKKLKKKKKKKKIAFGIFFEKKISKKNIFFPKTTGNRYLFNYFSFFQSRAVLLANLDTFMGAYRVLGSAQSNGPTLNASISTTVQDRMKRTSVSERGHRDTSKYTPFGEMGVDR